VGKIDQLIKHLSSGAGGNSGAAALLIMDLNDKSNAKLLYLRIYWISDSDNDSGSNYLKIYQRHRGCEEPAEPLEQGRFHAGHVGQVRKVIHQRVGDSRGLVVPLLAEETFPPYLEVTVRY